MRVPLKLCLFCNHLHKICNALPEKKKLLSNVTGVAANQLFCKHHVHCLCHARGATDPPQTSLLSLQYILCSRYTRKNTSHRLFKQSANLTQQHTNIYTQDDANTA